MAAAKQIAKQMTAGSTDIQAQKSKVRKLALATRKKLTQDADFILESVSLIGANLLSVPEVDSILCSKVSGSQDGKAESTTPSLVDMALPRSDSALPSSPIVTSYAPSKGEPDPNGFLDILESSGGVRPMMAFPRVSGKGSLSLHFALLDELLPGSFGIPEPEADLPLVNMADIDLILVPGVAFDRQGGRLGYGKGFYDRLLSRSAKLPLLVGISFDETLYDKVPSEPHDIKMNYIVTPTQIVLS